MGSVGVARDTLVVGGVYVPPKVPVAGAADANADADEDDDEALALPKGVA